MYENLIKFSQQSNFEYLDIKLLCRNDVEAKMNLAWPGAEDASLELWRLHELFFCLGNLDRQALASRLAASSPSLKHISLDIQPGKREDRFLCWAVDEEGGSRKIVALNETAAQDLWKREGITVARKP